jgi:cation diffusion facilitator CzcD-associated flavoprotein CzcO
VRRPEDVGILVLGAGFAGLAMACELKRAGRHDFVVLERSSAVGGTWRDNTYPGCACDIRSDLYSFSFAPNPDWTHRYARQPEIRAYLERTTDRFGVRRHIRFDHELLAARWDSGDARWHVHTPRGDFRARVLVSGHGPLISPQWPDLPGLDDFAGPRFHSARWRHDVDLAGRQVAVIGTGASAIQFVPEIAPVAGGVTVFQRTAPWVLARRDRPTPARRAAWFRRLPALQRIARGIVYARNELQFAVFRRPVAGRAAQAVARRMIRRQVTDPRLREQVTPSFRIGCKRILVSDDWYPALNRPDVALVDRPIDRVVADGVVTADGEHHRADVLIAATGFDATHPPVARLVTGADGRTLAEHWSAHMSALHGTAVAGFPNLFLLVGPNTALGHNSIVAIIQAQVRYVLQALTVLSGDGVRALEARADAQRAYDDGLQRALRRSVWVKGGCTSYYLDDTGRNTTLWPHRAWRFARSIRRLDLSEYQVHTEPGAGTPETSTQEAADA